MGLEDVTILDNKVPCMKRITWSISSSPAAFTDPNSHIKPAANTATDVDALLSAIVTGRV